MEKTQRILFTWLIAQFVNWVTNKGYEVAFDEVTVHSPRLARLPNTNNIITVYDAVHKSKSFHHSGCAADLIIYKDGVYLTDGTHPFYKEAGAYWKSLHRDCTHGLDFGDANHFSFGER